MQNIINLAQSNGLDIPLDKIIPDGKPHKFKLNPRDAKMSGWIVCYKNETLSSREEYYVAIIGNYQLGEKYIYNGIEDVVKKEKTDTTHARQQIVLAQKKYEEERLLIYNKTAEEASYQWGGLSEDGGSEYLEKKLIYEKKELGIRFYKDVVCVPMKDVDGKHWSIQKIFPDGKKNYMSGGKKSGNFHAIGNIKEDTLRLCEGFSTGASIFLAVGGCVIVTFDSGNLVTVAKILKERYPEKNFIICGDDDRFKVNPTNGEVINAGRTKGDEAAKLSLGKAVYPMFKDKDFKGTDFNDLHAEEGLVAVREQLEELVVPKVALYSLGFKEKEYFFTSTSNKQVVGVTSFTEADFLNLMPVEYWEAVYPSKRDSGGPDYNTAKSKLMESCRQKGLFSGFKIRGSGVWIDNKRIVVNMGDHLIVNSHRCDLSEIKSKFFYTLGDSLNELHPSPLTADECAPLINSCQNFQWTKKDSGILLAGALVLSRVCGALPVRPHLWVTGGAETGKTTLLEKLIYRIVGDNAFYASRGTTEAGVRQSLKANALPVVFDEFETNNTAGDSQIDSIIELCRGAWSDSQAKIIKGGANGNAVEYQARFSAIVSSIRTKLTNDADKGRFTVVELAPHGADQEHWARLKGFLQEINPEFSERLFSRIIRMLPVILENQKTMQLVLAKRSGSRFGDQYGMILAGYAALITDELLTEEEGEWFANQVTLEEEKENTKDADHKDCLSHLMTTAITYDQANGKVKESIGSMIDSLQKELAVSSVKYDQFKREALTTLGIRVESNNISVVFSKHAELQNSVFKNTKWSNNWGVSLKRISGAEKKRIRISKYFNAHAITIPNDALYLN